MLSFYRIPKLLFTNAYFKELDVSAKVLYGLMLDRMSLSLKNKWFDEQQRAFIYFAQQEASEMLGFGDDKIRVLFNKLEEFGLIERKKQGQGKPTIIYLKKFISEGMAEVSDLSGSLIESDVSEEGSVISAVYEGSRPVFFEIQALVTPANVGFARRTAVGINYNRVNMILAVLEKKAGISLLNHDVYVNVVGGMNTGSTSTDLAVALAIYSSFKGNSSPKRVVAVGEVGLTGHLRSVANADKIVQEAIRLGYEAVILPERNARHAAESGSVSVSDGGRSVTISPEGPHGGRGIRVIGASNITDAIRSWSSE